MRFRQESKVEKDIVIQKEIGVGSDAKFNTICIQLTSNDLNIELQHAVFRVNDENILTVEDLDTQSGTFVNSERIPPNEPRTLHEDDMICFGGSPIHKENKRVNPVLFRVVKTTQKRKREEVVPLAEAVDNTMKCSICMETFLDPVVLECEHMFCHDCHQNWMSAQHSSRTCPECRHPVTLGSKRVRKLDAFIMSVVEPTLPHEERKRRYMRREVLLNKSKLNIGQQTKVIQCTREDVMNIWMCIQRAREAVLMNNSVQQTTT